MNRKGLILGVIAFLIICVESSVLHRIEIYGIVPNLSLCLIVSSSLLLGSRTGGRLGLFVGLVQDLMFMRVIGFFTLVFFLVGYTAGLFKNRFDQNNLLLSVMITALFDFAFCLVCYLFLHYLQGRIQISFYLTRRILPELVYTTIASIPVYLFTRWVCWLSDRREERRRRLEANAAMPAEAGGADVL